MKYDFFIRFFYVICVIPFVGLFAAEKDYLTSELRGRLGNQLFSVAAAISLGIDNNAKVCFPELVTGKKNDIPTNREKIFWRLDKGKGLKKPTCIIKQTPKNLISYPLQYIKGMKLCIQPWSEKYFIHNVDKILPLFDPSEEIITDLYSKYSEIIDHPSSVSIHVRTLKGEEKAKGRRPLYGPKYIGLAMENFSADSLYVVFSDDINWCKQHLGHLSSNMVFIEDEPYYNDFYLMSLCKHNIVSNSTFSWWAAYLNKNKRKKIIAPKDFFYPSFKDSKHLTPVFYFYPNYEEKLEDFWPKEWTLISGNWE